MRLRSFVLFATILLCVGCLKNMPLVDNQQQNINKYLTSAVETFQFLGQDIMFVLADHSRFGFIANTPSSLNTVSPAPTDKGEEIKEKQTKDKDKVNFPTLSMVINVQPDQKISEINQQGVVLLQQGKSKIFVADSKQLKIHRPLKYIQNQRFSNSQIMHLIEFKNYQIVLTKQSLILATRGKDNPNIQSVSYIYNATSAKQSQSMQEQLRSLVKFNYKNEKNLKKSSQETEKPDIQQIVGLILQQKQQESRKICVKVFQISKQGKEVQQKDISCVPIAKESNFVKSVFSTGHVFIVMSDETIVLNQSLKIKNRLSKKPVTFSQNALVMEGGASFGQQKSALVDELIFESQENRILKLSSSESSLAISDARSGKTVVQLNKNAISSKPVNCWLSQKQQIGQKQTKQEPEKEAAAKQPGSKSGQKSKEIEIIVEWADHGLNYYRYNTDSKQVVREWRVPGKIVGN